MDRDGVRHWVDRYVEAWTSNDRGDIESLFAEDAVYLTGPFDEPWEGRDEIVKRWLARRDEPGDTTFDYEVIAAEESLGVVEGVTRYQSTGEVFGNIWLIRLDDGGGSIGRDAQQRGGLLPGAFTEDGRIAHHGAVRHGRRAERRVHPS